MLPAPSWFPFAEEMLARLSDRSPLVRAHAGWALARLAESERTSIQIARDRETDPEAREDLAKTLQDAESAAH